jgi:NAD(P)-dependent dehydrogenase (short-subunit alcohol dehydrogenase family)
LRIGSGTAERRLARSKEMELVSENSERIISVTGATGRQGGAVYQHLRKKGFKCALVRNPNSNQARQLMGYGEKEKVFQEASMIPTA